MNCREAVRALAESPRAELLPAEAQEHLMHCKRCQRLARAMNPPAGAATASPVVLSRLEQALAGDLRPVRPLWPRRYFFIAFIAVLVSVVAIGVRLVGALATPAMTPGQMTAILFALAGSAGLLAHSLVQQMTPGGEHWISPRLLPAAIMALLSLVIAGSFQFRYDRDFLEHGWPCLRGGIPFALFAAVPFWLLLRRGAILAPGVTGAATGLLAGLTGTSVLEFHCPNLDASHILTWHLGVATVSAGIGLTIGLAAEAAGRRSKAARR